MELPRYSVAAGEDLTTFEFTSEGPKGEIRKWVSYTKTSIPGVVILAFGDKNKITGKIDDRIVSNNGDSEKVLATVIKTIYLFTAKYPGSFIYATGSTKSRTRLYRMGISKYYTQASIDFEIYGETEKGWEPFRKGVDYEAFFIRRKKLI